MYFRRGTDECVPRHKWQKIVDTVIGFIEVPITTGNAIIQFGLRF